MMTRIGFVSLLLDFENEPVDFRSFAHIENKFDYSRKFIDETSQSRLKDVIANIKWAEKNNVNLLLFPGWTLSSIEDLISVTKHVGEGLHVILELCKGAVEFRNVENNNKDRKKFKTENFNNDSGVFILNNGEVINGPIFQVFAYGKQELEKEWMEGYIEQLKFECSKKCRWDYRDKGDEYVGFAQGRWVDLGNDNQFLLILCGETQLTNNINFQWLDIAKSNGFDRIDYSKAKAILNPSHTPFSSYMVNKRFAWSQLTGVPLIACSNFWKTGKKLKRDSNGEKCSFIAAKDGSQFFTKDNVYKLNNNSQNETFINEQLENHSTDKYQRAIVSL